MLRPPESDGRLRAALASSLHFGAAHLSLLAVGVPIVEGILVAVSSMVVAIGLAAFAGEAIGAYLVADTHLVLGLAIRGVWLLSNDRTLSIGDGDPACNPIGPA